MTFLNPLLAAIGLGAVALPIIIHILMRRRRRPIAWGAMKFLLEAYQRQRRRMNLEQLLLLACRCLLVILIALAVGKPVLGAFKASAQGPRTVYLLIDNGVASSAVPPGEQDAALIRSRAAALDLLATLDPSRGDRAAIISLAGPAESLIMPATADLAAASEVVRSLRPLDSRTDVPGALARIRDELRRAPPPEGADVWVALLSDGRAGSAEVETTLAPLTQGTTAIHAIALSPADTPLTNIGITSVEPARSVLLTTSDAGSLSATAMPTATTPVRIMLHRSGAGTATAAISTVTVEVSPAGAPAASHGPRAQTTVPWSPGQDSATANVSVDVPLPAQGARAPIALTATIDADPISADNTFRRPIDLRERLEVTLLAPGPVGGKGTITSYTPADWLALALAPEADPMRRRQSGELRVSVLDPARALAPLPGSRSPAGALADMDAVIIPRPDLIDTAGWRTVRAACDAGAVLLIAPPTGVQSHTWTDAMLAGLSLDWQLPREATAFTPALSLAPDRPTATGPDLLELISAELPELLKRVTVLQALAITGPPGSFDPLLMIDRGPPLLVAAQPGSRAAPSAATPAAPTTAPRGLILFFTTALDLAWTDLPTKPVMVPLIQELVRQGVGRSSGVRTALAGVAPTIPAATSELAPLADAGPQAADTPAPAVIPVDASGRVPPIRAQGLFAARSASGSTNAILAINADAAGGLADTRTRDELARWLAPAAADLTWLEPGTPGLTPSTGPTTITPATALLALDSKVPPISFPLLLAALAIAAIETAIARWFSHARADAGTLPLSTSTAASTGSAAA